MLRYIKGKFYPEANGQAVVETASGIGFLCSIASNSPLYKNFDGEEVKVYVLMTVREDDMSLYGFSSEEELDLFKLLISVNGVGAKGGLAIMGILPTDELKRSIASGDSQMLSRANGIGKKTAERIIIDLKDKVGDYRDDGTTPGVTQEGAFTSERTEAISALVSLGYSKGEAERAVTKVKDNDLAAEDYIKLALKNM